MKIGCCGFPVARQRFFRELEALEVNATFYRLPRLQTVRRWREEAPPGFVFTVKAWQLITHTPNSPTYRRLGRSIPERRKNQYGSFRGTDEVRQAWRDTAAVAVALKARAVLFQTPSTFYPHPDLLRNLYRFFKSVPRHGMVFVWEPRGSWPEKTVRQIGRDLDIVIAVDPLHRPEWRSFSRYYRLHGAYHGRRIDYGHTYSDSELKKLTELLRGRPAYLFFNNRAMWNDAQRFRDLWSREGYGGTSKDALGQ